jgi:hypothetical protein
MLGVPRLPGSPPRCWYITVYAQTVATSWRCHDRRFWTASCCTVVIVTAVRTYISYVEKVEYTDVPAATGIPAGHLVYRCGHTF